MSYEKFVLKSVRSQLTPRTLAEAYQTPEYACAIYRFETENERGMKALTSAFLCVTMLSVALFVVYGFALWLS